MRGCLAALVFLAGCSSHRSDGCVASEEPANATVEVLDVRGDPLESVPVVATLAGSVIDCRATAADGRVEIHLQSGSAVTAYGEGGFGPDRVDSQSVTRTNTGPGDFLRIILTSEEVPYVPPPSPVAATLAVVDGLGSESTLGVTGGCNAASADGPDASVALEIRCLQSDGAYSLTAAGAGPGGAMVSIAVALDVALATTSVPLVLATATDVVAASVRFPPATQLSYPWPFGGMGARAFRKGLPIGSLHTSYFVGTAGELSAGLFTGLGPSVADSLEIGMMFGVSDTAGEYGLASALIRQDELWSVDRNFSDFGRAVALSREGPSSGDPLATWSLVGAADRVRVDFVWPIGEPGEYPEPRRHRATVFVDPSTLVASIPVAPRSLARFRPEAGTEVGVVVLVYESDFVTGYADFPGWFDFLGVTGLDVQRPEVCREEVHGFRQRLSDRRPFRSVTNAQRGYGTGSGGTMNPS